MIPLPALLPLLKNKYVIGGVVVLATLVVGFTWHSFKAARALDDAYTRGMKDERAVWQVRLVEEVTAANRKHAELQEKYRALEKKSADDLAAIAAEHQKEKANAGKKLEKALADARSGMEFRLRWASTCAPTPRDDPSGSAATKPGAAPGSAVGTATCELPRETAEDLIRLASEADGVVAERNALLEIAKKDREVCK